MTAIAALCIAAHGKNGKKLEKKTDEHEKVEVETWSESESP